MNIIADSESAIFVHAAIIRGCSGRFMVRLGLEFGGRNGNILLSLNQICAFLQDVP
jgi:hypothetical protein